MSEKQQVWFTSDTHFGHENVIRYSNRPYRDKYEMDEALIKNWNDRVKPTDHIYHLGDVFFCREQRAMEIMARLNGQKHLIFGNHDKQVRRMDRMKAPFIKCSDYHEMYIDDQKIILSHYPMITWNGAARGAWMLHGHCHGNLKYPFEAKIHDVGVDPNDQAPISFEQLKTIMAKKKMTAVDHHRGMEED